MVGRNPALNCARACERLLSTLVNWNLDSLNAILSCPCSSGLVLTRATLTASPRPNICFNWTFMSVANFS